MAEQIIMAWLGLGATGLVAGAAGVRLTARRMRLATRGTVETTSAATSSSDELLNAA